MTEKNQDNKSAKVEVKVELSKETMKEAKRAYRAVLSGSRKLRKDWYSLGTIWAEAKAQVNNNTQAFNKWGKVHFPEFFNQKRKFIISKAQNFAKDYEKYEKFCQENYPNVNSPDSIIKMYNRAQKKAEAKKAESGSKVKADKVEQEEKDGVGLVEAYDKLRTATVSLSRHFEDGRVNERMAGDIMALATKLVDQAEAILKPAESKAA